MYAASKCTTCAAYPSAVAIVSSVTSLCDGNERGGAGSVTPTGMGSGTSKIVNNRSGGDRSSMGKMEASVLMTSLRRGLISLRSESSRCLQGGVSTRSGETIGDGPLVYDVLL